MPLGFTRRTVWLNASRTNPSAAFDLSRLADLSLARTPIGVFRAVSRPVYDDLMREQVQRSQEADGFAASNGSGALSGLLAGADTWTVP